MWVVQIKYHKIAIPFEDTFETEKEARDYAVKEKLNPYVRWVEVYEIEETQH